MGTGSPALLATVLRATTDDVYIIKPHVAVAELVKARKRIRKTLCLGCVQEVCPSRSAIATMQVIEEYRRYEYHLKPEQNVVVSKASNQVYSFIQFLFAPEAPSSRGVKFEVLEILHCPLDRQPALTGLLLLPILTLLYR